MTRKTVVRAEDLPPEQMEAIGRVTVEWSYLESTIDVAIARFGAFSSDEIADAVTANLRGTQNGRLPLLARLFDLSCDQGSDPWIVEARRREFDALLKRVRHLEELRNKFVHARWVKGGGGSPFVYRVKARGELRRDLDGWSASEVREVANQITEHCDVLRPFFCLEKEWMVSPWW